MFNLDSFDTVNLPAISSKWIKIGPAMDALWEEKYWHLEDKLFVFLLFHNLSVHVS